MAILRAWRETEHMSDYDAMQHQDKIGWEVFASEDAQEGPKAFAEKRAPAVQGPVARVSEAAPGLPDSPDFATPGTRPARRRRARR